MLDFEKVLDVATQKIDEIYSQDKRRKGIVCPICGNGQGKDGDGVTFVKSGSPILKCFRCGFSGNVINMTAKAQNISYREAAEILAEKLGIDETNYQYDPNRRMKAFDVPKIESAIKDIPEEKVDQTKYYKRVEEHLTDTDYPKSRGLSLETCRRFHLGFDKNWRHPKNLHAPSSPRLIIPTSAFSYLARDVRKNSNKRFSKQKFGSMSIFNVENIGYEYTFVTEGEIDAMSFYELCHADAVALGSVSYIKKFVDHLKMFEGKKPKYLIAALDNDEAGQEGNLKLKQALKEIGINVLIADFIYRDLDNNIDYKDANEILVKNREAFADNVELIWKIADQYYESDKLASQIVSEMNATIETPYSEEELSSMIKEPEFTAEKLQSMFEDEKFSNEELTQMLSKGISQSIESDRVKKNEPLYPGGIFNYSFDISKHPPTRYRDFPEKYPNELQVRYAMNGKLVKVDPIELKKSKDLLQSITEFNFKTVYTPKVLWALAYCLLSIEDVDIDLNPENYAEFVVNCEDNGVNHKGFIPFVNEYVDKFKMVMNQKYWASEELKLSDEEKTALIASSSLIKNSKNEESLSNQFWGLEQDAENVAEIPAAPSEEITPQPKEEEKVVPVSIAQDLIVATETAVISSIQTFGMATVFSTELSELEKSKNLLSSITEFNNDTIFAPETLQAAAYCKVYEPLEFVKFLEHCRENKIEITLLKEYIRQIAQPFEKTKRRNDNQKEKERVAEETKRKKEELKIERYNNSVKMNALLNQPQSPERDRKLIEFVQNSLERDYNGRVNSSSVANFELALNFDPIIRECVGYDAFSQKIVARRKLPWTDDLSSQSVWTNYDDVGLQNYLNRTYELNNERIFFNVLFEYAQKNSFHPVKNYFEKLPEWDRITRAVEYFIENLEIADSRYSREVIKSWMIAAIARVFHPGCKWDYILVIKGEHGFGKSTFFSKLAGKWFNDSIENIGGKETLENLFGSWIIELCEMQAFEEADNKIIQSFTSRQKDKFRVPYGRRTEEFLRQCVFVATTDDEEFLKDCADNQRFLVLVSEANDRSCREKLSKLGADYIGQIWAEIFHYYHQLFSADEVFDSSKLLPDNDILEIAKEIRKNYTEDSGLAGMIETYLEIKIPESAVWEEYTMSERREYIQNYSASSLNENSKLVPRKVVSAIEIAYELLRIDNPYKEKGTLKKIGAILSKMKGWHRVAWKYRGVYGQQRVSYERLAEPPVA